MDNSVFYTLLSIAITVNSITGLVNDTLANLLDRRVCKVNPGNIINNFLGSEYKDDLFLLLKRLMIFEVIWAILQLFGCLSLQKCPVFLIILLFIPQFMIGLAYLLMVWIVGADLALKRFRGNERKEKCIIVACLLGFIIFEPVLPILADRSIMKINKIKQFDLPEIYDDSKMPMTANSSTTPAAITQAQKERAIENARLLRKKFKFH